MATYSLNGDQFSAIAEEEYEAEVLAQARGIVSGALVGPPTAEHLRVVLGRLDGALRELAPPALDERPF